MPGNGWRTPWSLLPELAVQERDAERERRRLETLACWAAVLPPKSRWLCPMRCCLRLRARCASLAAPRCVAGARSAGHRGLGASWACRPGATPAAALWLAAAGKSGEYNAVPRCLCMWPIFMMPSVTLPLDVLELDARPDALPSGFGARQLGDLACRVAVSPVASASA